MVPTAVPARIALAAGFLAATFAYGAWISTRTAFDPDATRDVAKELLASSPVHDTLVDELERQVQTAVGSKSLDPTVARALDAAAEDRRLEAAFSDAITAYHRALLDGRKDAITLDVTEVTASVRDALATIDPALATRIDDAEPIRIDLGDAGLPAVSRADDRARAVLVVSTLLAIALLVAGVALHPSQRDALARIGRRVALLAIGPFIGFVVLPWVLDGSGNDAAGMASAVLDVYGGRVLPSAVVLAIGGLGLWVGARTWPSGVEPVAATVAYAPPPPTREKLYL